MAIGHGASCWFLGVAARAHVPVSDEPTAGRSNGLAFVLRRQHSFLNLHVGVSRYNDLVDRPRAKTTATCKQTKSKVHSSRMINDKYEVHE